MCSLQAERSRPQSCHALRYTRQVAARRHVASGRQRGLDALSQRERGGLEVHFVDDSGFVNTRRAEAYLELSPRTLDGHRVSGEGPAFHRFGNRVRYRTSDLDLWAAGRRATTTAEADRLGAANKRKQARTSLAIPLASEPSCASCATGQRPLPTSAQLLRQPAVIRDAVPGVSVEEVEQIVRMLGCLEANASMNTLKMSLQSTLPTPLTHSHSACCTAGRR